MTTPNYIPCPRNQFTYKNVQCATIFSNITHLVFSFPEAVTIAEDEVVEEAEEDEEYV